MRRKILSVLAAVIFASSGNVWAQSTGSGQVLDGKFWREQALETIIPFWTRHGIDSNFGGFFTHLDRYGQRTGGSEKYPSMLSRNVFSYSVAYLLTGRKEYIEEATKGVDFLLIHAWDSTYGGWFDELDEGGNPLRTTKDGFVQVYATTGLTMYYFVTHDSAVLSYIERSNDLMQTCSWDRTWGGYYKGLNRDLSVGASDKDFTSQVAPVSGYLLYLYLATREEKYLVQTRRVVDLVQERMSDPHTGWILESFDRRWTRAGASDLNVGHNIEFSWVGLRLSALDRTLKYRESAQRLASELGRWGMDTATGLWRWRLEKDNLSAHSDDAAWWIQAYGNMLQLFLYHVTAQPEYLHRFEKGAEAWNRYFVDREFGDTFLSVYLDGRVKDSTKGDRYKASYHSMEHCLLNFLYLDLWVNKSTVDLYFDIHPAGKDTRLYPAPLEDPEVRIVNALVNGTPWNDIHAQEGYVALPRGEEMLIKVTISK